MPGCSDSTEGEQIILELTLQGWEARARKGIPGTEVGNLEGTEAGSIAWCNQGMISNLVGSQQGVGTCSVQLERERAGEVGGARASKAGHVKNMGWEERDLDSHTISIRAPHVSPSMSFGPSVLISMTRELEGVVPKPCAGNTVPVDVKS